METTKRQSLAQRQQTVNILHNELADIRKEYRRNANAVGALTYYYNHADAILQQKKGYYQYKKECQRLRNILI